MLWLLIVVIVTIFIWFKLNKPLRYWADKGVKQVTLWPILGDVLNTIFPNQSFADFLRELYNKYPTERYVGYYKFSHKNLLIKDVELIRQIAIKDFDYFTDHKSINDPNSLWNGNLLFLKGQKWREMRATLSGSFTSSKMKIISVLMEETSRNFVKYFLDKNEDLIEMEFKDCCTRFTNDIIASVAFGIQVDSLKHRENIFYKMGKKILNLKITRSLKFLIIRFVPKFNKIINSSAFDPIATNYFQNVIEDMIKTREKKDIVRPDMINLLLETRKGISHQENATMETGYATVQEFRTTFKTAKNLTNEEIVSQALLFFLAGFETVATAMCFCLYELAINKDIQNRLRQEIKKTEENNEKNSYDTLIKMKYLDMVVSESLRKWPPQVAIDRVCTKPYTVEPAKPGEKLLHIEIGDILWFPFDAIHRDPDFFPNPDKFDPERFSPENKDKIVPYTYLPFGIGPRNCIGSRFALLEMKMLLYNLIMNFEIIPTDKTEIPIKLKKAFLQIPVNGFWFGLKRIE